jgi:hypothetical protein
VSGGRDAHVLVVAQSLKEIAFELSVCQTRSRSETP